MSEGDPHDPSLSAAFGTRGIDPDFVPAEIFLPETPGTPAYAEWLSGLESDGDDKRALAGRIRERYGN